MATQTSFVERTPEERKAWVIQQRALGNKNILSEREWYKKNEVRIKLDNFYTYLQMIEKAVKAEHEENKKFRETVANAIKQLVK